jgi:hypothetical protein
LDRTTWDLFADASGNIAMAEPPYAVAQDVATACRCFLGDCYYSIGQGIPYLQQILGNRPTIPLITTALNAQALTVPGVVKANSAITSFVGRNIGGYVEVLDETGQSLGVTI